MAIIKEEDLVQGSKAWHAVRKMGIGSSEIGTIMGVNPYRNVYDLWLEKTGQKEPEDISEKYAVKRGTLLEPFARNIFNQNNNKEFIPASFVHRDISYFKYSSDGYDEKYNEIIEIKSMGKNNHQKCIDINGPLDYYYHQCQWGLMISETKICHFISYNPTCQDPIFSCVIKEDLDEQLNMTEMAHRFWKCVQDKTKPDW